MSRGGPATASAAMVSTGRTHDAFYLKLQEGQANWRALCREEFKTTAKEIEFLGQVRDSAILHVGTHGQISVELFDPRTNQEVDPEFRLGLDGTIGCRVDAPARFQRFDLPPGVKSFHLYEGAIAPGVCFSDEKVSFKTMMAVLRRAPDKRTQGLVKAMDIDPSGYDSDPDYEIDMSNKLVPHKKGEFAKHHWQERLYTPQRTPVVAAAPGMRRNYPIVKRFITTVSELKTADIRLLEWHIVAFIVHEGSFLVIDLNPYLFPEEIARSRMRSSVGDRSDINDYLYGVTNTSRLVDLFHRTKDITVIDSTCSVLRLKVSDGPNGNQTDGSVDGVIDSFDVRRYKLELDHLLTSKPSDQKIKKLVRNIKKWYQDKGIVPDVEDTDLSNIKKMLTNINYDSIWIKPVVHAVAMHALMNEIREYMGQVITDPKEVETLMNWIDRYLRSDVRRLTLLEKARERRKKLGLEEDTDAVSSDSSNPGTPLAALSHRRRDPSRHTSSFQEVLEGDDGTSISPSTKGQLLGKSKSKSKRPSGHGGGKKTKTRRGKRNKSRNFRNKSRSKSRHTRRRVIKRKNN
jgi:hypothetical protein